MSSLDVLGGRGAGVDPRQQQRFGMQANPVQQQQAMQGMAGQFGYGRQLPSNLTQRAGGGVNTGQGLPPTGLQQQLASLNAFYDQISRLQFGGDQTALETSGFTGVPGQISYQNRNIGWDVRAAGMRSVSEELPSHLQQQERRGQIGQTSLNDLARNLAQSYGLAIGRGRIVDERGNLLITPDQLAAASGGAETLGTAAAKLNYISQAIAKEQTRQQQQKGIAAIQTGMGQIQSRGRGSLAALQSGLYQDLADLYSNQEFEAADYSYFIQKEQQDIEAEILRRQEKVMKSRAIGQVIGGGLMLIGGAVSGNWAVAGQGGAMVAQGGGTLGWY